MAEEKMKDKKYNIKKGIVILTEAEIEHITTSIKETIKRFEEHIPISEGILKDILIASIKFDKDLITKLEKVKMK